ncbi:MAG: hypothetical protein U1F15_07295 [Burkholderiales bacterium]
MTAAPLAWMAAAAALALAAPVAAQQPKPIANGDAAAGKVLVERDCIACHARRFGDAATIYTRADRRVQSPAQLLAQVQFCNVELKSGYFPDEEEHVAAYLNQQYYKFKP